MTSDSTLNLDRVAKVAAGAVAAAGSQLSLLFAALSTSDAEIELTLCVGTVPKVAALRVDFVLEKELLGTGSCAARVISQATCKLPSWAPHGPLRTVAAGTYARRAPPFNSEDHAEYLSLLATVTEPAKVELMLNIVAEAWYLP